MAVRLLHRAPLLAFVVTLLLMSACADVSPRTRLARTIVAVGALVGVTGGVLVAGCVPDGVPGPCSAGPGDGTVRIGLPILAVGAALMTAGMLMRPPSARPGGPPTVQHGTPSLGDSFGPPPLQGY